MSTATAGEKSAARKGSTTSVGSTARKGRAVRVKSAARKGRSDRKGTTAKKESTSVGSTPKMNCSVAKLVFFPSNLLLQDYNQKYS